ncbi:hypothetical protein AB8O53_35145, partial [Streptomyces pilosus]
MRLRRGVVVGLVVRYGVVAAVAGRSATVRGGSVRGGRYRLPDDLGLPGLLPLVRLGRRQREHGARRGLLRSGPLGGGGQRPPAPSRRLL